VVAGDVLHQQQQPRRRIRRAVHRLDPGVAAHHRLEALAAAGLVVLDRAEQVAQVGNAQGQLPVVLGCGHRIVDPQGAIDDGVFGVQAQVNKTHRGIVRSGVRVLDLGGGVTAASRGLPRLVAATAHPPPPHRKDRGVPMLVRSLGAVALACAAALVPAHAAVTLIARGALTWTRT
jgi:hypothetical protein